MAINLRSSALISAEALHLQLSDVVVVDASWHLPSSKRNAYEEYLQAHIKNATFFDLDACVDKASALPHMLPTPELFAETVESLGISSDSDVVIYDTQGLFSAARLWWMFRVFGHERVRVLDGGLSVWKSHGFVCDSGEKALKQRGGFRSHLQSHLVADILSVSIALAKHSASIVDARSASRFRGLEPEPRAGLRSGHMPNAHNIHYASLLTPEGMLLPRDALRGVFDAAGVDVNSPIIASCGSGVTACIIALALYELGYPNTPVYDGSWAEWGASVYPVVVG